MKRIKNKKAILISVQIAEIVFSVLISVLVGRAVIYSAYLQRHSFQAGFELLVPVLVAGGLFTLIWKLNPYLEKAILGKVGEK